MKILITLFYRKTRHIVFVSLLFTSYPIESFAQNNIHSKIIQNPVDSFVINKYMYYASFIKPIWCSRSEFDSLHNKIMVKSYDNIDSLNNKYGFLLYIPQDISYFELPLQIKNINEALYGNKLIPDAELNHLYNDLRSLLLYIESYRAKNNSITKLKNQIIELQTKYWPEKNMTSTGNYKTLASDWLINSIDIEEKYYGINYVDSMEVFLQRILLGRIKTAFYISIIDHGINMLGDIKYFKDSLKTSSLELMLNKARKTGNSATISSLEKQLEKKLATSLNRFYSSTKYIKHEYIEPDATSPVCLIRKPLPECAGLVSISWYYLNKWKINTRFEHTVGHAMTGVINKNKERFVIDPKNTGFIEKATFCENIITIQNDGRYHCCDLEIKPGIVSSIFYNIGGAYADKKDNFSSILFWNESLLLEPSSSNLKFNIVLNLEKEKKYEKALIEISKAILLHPDHWLYLSYKSDILFKLKRYDEANAIMWKCEELKGESNNPVKKK